MRDYVAEGIRQEKIIAIGSGVSAPDIRDFVVPSL